MDSNRPVSFRPRSMRRSTSFSSRSQFSSFQARMLKRAEDLYDKGSRIYLNLTPLQRVGVVVLGFIIGVGGLLSLVYHEAIFTWMTNSAKGWRNLTGGWLILWMITFMVSFPPLIGYSTCVMLGGYVYGFPNGWFIVATGSTCGATAAFITSRSLFKSYVDRLVASDARFAAFALVLKHDGLKFLCMIRLCPLPFSFSNGALSTIPTISWPVFMAATALVTPKLLLHVWIGAQLAKLAEHGEEMDTKTRLISYLGIAIGMVAGLVTTYLIYAQTKQRMKDIEELERAETGGRMADSVEFEDDPELAEAADVLREDEDDISLRDAWDDDAYYDESSEPTTRDTSPLPRR